MVIIDRETYFQMTFQEQMSWLGEEVEHIIKQNEAYHIKQKIQQQGREAYGQTGHTHAIKRLFDIIRADPKNRPLLREVDRAERELTAFLYDEPDALPEEEIFTYWNDYLWAYMAELESRHAHYFVMRGYDEFHDDDEWIGVYHAWNRARDAYNKAVRQLEEEHQSSPGNFAKAHERIMVHIFDETTGKWEKDVDPELIFKRNNPSDREKYKEIECVIDAEEMLQWKRENVRRSLSGYCCDAAPNKSFQKNEYESIPVRFEVEHTYQAFDLLDQYWGSFNACPDCRTMKDAAKEWHERYGAELTRIAHNSLTFQCGSLSEKEAEEIIAQASRLHGEIIDCRPENLVSYLTKECRFTLWWD